MRELIPLLVFLAAPALASEVSGRVALDGAKDATVIVYIERAKDAGPPAAHRPKLTQRNAAFSPSTLVVVQGESVDFPNEDKIFHNVFSVTEGNDFDLGLYRGGASKSVAMHQPGEVDVYCNIHPAMAAKILVLQNGYYTQVRADGSYTLAGVPPGRYTLVAWSPAHEAQKLPITVGSGATTASFHLKPRTPVAGHLNKTGEQYGRYK